MLKRLVAAPLWFVAVWCLYDLAAYFTGAPRPVGPVLGIALAVFVAVDPGHLIWENGPRSAPPSTAPHR